MPRATHELYGARVATIVTQLRSRARPHMPSTAQAYALRSPLLTSERTLRHGIASYTCFSTPASRRSRRPCPWCPSLFLTLLPQLPSHVATSAELGCSLPRALFLLFAHADSAGLPAIFIRRLPLRGRCRAGVPFLSSFRAHFIGSLT